MSLGPGGPPTVCGAEGPTRPPARLPLPVPLGVFSEQTAFLQGFTRDPPHPPQEGDTQCPLLLKTQTKALPLPQPPWEPSQGLRGARAWTCLHQDPPLVYLLCSLGPREPRAS